MKIAQLPIIAMSAAMLLFVNGTQAAEPFPPNVDNDCPKEVFFGDTHLHTALSFDAGMIGATLMPSDGYRFAKGKEDTSSTGLRVQLSRPLDLVVVSDHSDNMGFATDFQAGAENIRVC